jgi:agmatinase
LSVETTTTLSSANKVRNNRATSAFILNFTDVIFKLTQLLSHVRTHLKDVLETLGHMFTIPEETTPWCSFADLPQKISFQEADVVIYGVPLDMTTSFGKGTSRGPEAIRLTSARQIETFIFEENKDIQSYAKIYDLGNLKLPSFSTSKKNNHTSWHNIGNNNSVFSFLDSRIPKINRILFDNRKIPLIIGGEHTVSYYAIKAFAKEKPLIVHFDAHRDMKDQYDGLKICHTTPFFHLVNEGYVGGNDIIQIGIRQSDEQENITARNWGVVTFDAWDVHYRFDRVLKHIGEVTENRKIYISFDIDVYDIPYVPCTGTAEPFGLNPFQVVDILKNIHDTAILIGMDIVEVSVKNDDYREGTLATQTLFRILSRGPRNRKKFRDKNNF